MRIALARDANGIARRPTLNRALQFQTLLEIMAALLGS